MDTYLFATRNDGTVIEITSNFVHDALESLVRGNTSIVQVLRILPGVPVQWRRRDSELLAFLLRTNPIHEILLMNLHFVDTSIGELADSLVYSNIQKAEIINVYSGQEKLPIPAIEITRALLSGESIRTIYLRGEFNPETLTEYEYSHTSARIDRLLESLQDTMANVHLTIFYNNDMFDYAEDAYTLPQNALLTVL